MDKNMESYYSTHFIEHLYMADTFLLDGKKHRITIYIVYTYSYEMYKNKNKTNSWEGVRSRDRAHVSPQVHSAPPPRAQPPVPLRLTHGPGMALVRLPVRLPSRSLWSPSTHVWPDQKHGDSDSPAAAKRGWKTPLRYSRDSEIPWSDVWPNRDRS